MLRAVFTEEELGNIVHSPRGREGHEENKTYVSANKHGIIGKKIPNRITLHLVIKFAYIFSNIHR